MKCLGGRGVLSYVCYVTPKPILLNAISVLVASGFFEADMSACERYSYCFLPLLSVFSLRFANYRRHGINFHLPAKLPHCHWLCVFQYFVTICFC